MSIRELNILSNQLVKTSMKFEDMIWNQLKASINNLEAHKLILPIDAQIMKDPGWLLAAFKNWKEEFQYSSRCPECMIDIPGPRKLMHMHLKMHQSKKDHIKENEPWNQNFRVHF